MSLRRQRGLVEEVIGLAVAPGLAADGDLGVLGVLAAGASVAVVEHQLDRGLRHRLAAVGAVEHHVGHGIAAQMLGRDLAHHPADGVDDVRLAAAVRADDADQVGVDGDDGGIDERLETGEFDRLEPHRIL